MKIADFISPDTIDVDLEAADKEAAMAELGRLLAKVNPRADEEEIARVLLDRERLATTGIGDGVAIPHGKMDGVSGLTGAVALSRAGVMFDSVDGNPVRIFVALLAPKDSPGDHLKALARVARVLKDGQTRARLLEAGSSAVVHAILLEEDGRH